MHASSLGDTQLGDDSLSMLTNLQRLGKDLERRKTSYYVREDAYKERVAALEEELASQNRGSPSGKKSESKLDELKMIQNEILESVELVQDRTARIMQEQERDLLRSFRARLFDVQTELEKEKGKKDDGLAAWRERYTQLEAELDWATEVSNRLDKVNQTLAHENSELKVKFNSQEQDRNLFIELLVSLKKDNALWRQKNSELVTENEARKVELAESLELTMGHPPIVVAVVKVFTGGPANVAAAAQAALLARQESEEKFKDANVRLRRLVAEERKNLQQVRQSYAQELKMRTEMELLLRKCVDDVRQAIAELHHESAQFSKHTAGNDLCKLYNAQPGAVPFEAFDAEEQQHTLELLLSQERVVSLIYAKTFPVVIRAAPTAKGHSFSKRQPGSPIAGDLAGLEDVQEVDESRPHTAGALNDGSHKSGKFPPIAKGVSR